MRGWVRSWWGLGGDWHPGPGRRPTGFQSFPHPAPWRLPENFSPPPYHSKASVTNNWRMEYCTIYFFQHCSYIPPLLLLLPPSFVLNSQVANFLEGCCKKRINVYCNKNRQNRRTSVEIYISNILNNLDNSTLKEPFCVNLMTTSSQFYVKRSLPICNIFSPEVRSWAMCLAIFYYPTLLHFTLKTSWYSSEEPATRRCI